MLKNSEDDLAVDTCHSKSLHKTAQAVLNVIRCIVLSLQVLFQAAFALIILASKSLCYFVNLNSARMQKHLCSNPSRNLFVNLRKCFIYLRIKLFWFIVCSTYQLLDNTFVLSHLNNCGDSSLARV